MGFSIKNGLKMTRYHLKDSQIMVSFAIVSLPALALFEKLGWKPALIYEIILILFFILVRCWDDPVKLGYEAPDYDTSNNKQK